MNEPDWAKVLNYLYDEQEKILYLHRLGESNDIVEKTGIEPDKVESILNDMADIGLLEDSYPPISGEPNLTMVEFSLSKKGFDVAHERELSKSRHKISKKSSRLSAYLVLAIISQVAVAFTQPQSPTGMILTGLIIFGIVVAVGFEVAEEPLRSLGNWIGDKLF